MDSTGICALWTIFVLITLPRPLYRGRGADLHLNWDDEFNFTMQYTPRLCIQHKARSFCTTLNESNLTHCSILNGLYFYLTWGISLLVKRVQKLLETNDCPKHPCTLKCKTKQKWAFVFISKPHLISIIIFKILCYVIIYCYWIFYFLNRKMQNILKNYLLIISIYLIIEQGRH